MKICVFTHTYPRFPGDPVAPFMEDFCKGLISQHNQVFLLAPFDTLFLLKDKEKNLKITLYKYIFPEKLHTLGYSRTFIGDQKLKLSVYLLSPFMFFFSFFALLKLVKEFKIDIISAHWIFPNGFVASLVSIITGVPIIVSIPGSDVYLAKKNFLFRFIAKLALNKAKLITSNSMQYIEELYSVGIDLKKCVEIPYGVNVKSFQNNYKWRKIMRKKYNIINSDKVIMAVGRLVEKKGFEYLIKSIPIVLKKNKNTKLIIIGGGSEKTKYQKLTKSLKVENKAHFIGQVGHTDLPKYYTMADVYVAPSVKDSKGNMESHIVALFEAIASGLPIVATELAVSDKYVSNGINGYRVEDKNSLALASAILSVLNSSKLNEMGKQSKVIAKKYLSYEKMATKFMTHANKILTKAI